MSRVIFQAIHLGTRGVTRKKIVGEESSPFEQVGRETSPSTEDCAPPSVGPSGYATTNIEEEDKGRTGLERLDILLLKKGEFDKTEEPYTVLLEQTSDERQVLHCYNQPGSVKTDQNGNEKAIWYYEKST